MTTTSTAKDQQATGPAADEFPYNYFVAFAVVDRHGNVGFGSQSIGTRRRVTTIEDTNQFAHSITEWRGLSPGTVSVINFQLLSAPAEDEV
ncbi:hypothetical protein [Verrucosispora sp. WMMC514]|uniref:hypothetical protein n=1 Tax=Verrucosispora sp. WMMC514 TaxID=3015156 RepID=UPI00248C514E|nr:hypothetical protein [Verrucosispora sp. WMMC514]WBB94148.1 hypothetical protein O7597_14965 [Verrucosispora sp. WMMC514]